MTYDKVQHLIINSPYEKPDKHLKYDRNERKFELVEGRRPAGYTKASEQSEKFDDPGFFVELPEVNKIRERVDKWRDSGYQGITKVTKELLDYWKKPDRDRKLFFCQLEAIETLIWFIEAPPTEKQGIKLEGDGGNIERLCSKMATGTGKTVVMAMLIAWQIINKMTYRQDTRFSKDILVVSPGLTVRNRLQVLSPTASEGSNYYIEFDLIPSGMYDKLRGGHVKIINWHLLEWETEDQVKRKKSVDKRGVKSDESYAREVLGELKDAKNIIVINDEAHHAWRFNPEALGKYVRQRDMKDSANESTVWIGGLDKINNVRNIMRCFDFTATPFLPSGKTADEDSLFGWIVSDFGLNEAIESGLVKTPRVVVRDDGTPNAKTMKSKFYHIYVDPKVKSNLNQAEGKEVPLPDLVTKAYYFLGLDWLETLKLWENSAETPPVMISVCNRTETAARVKFSLDKGKIMIKELQNPDATLQIDTKVLNEAESGLNVKGGASKKTMAEELREKVDTVGQKGHPGEKIQHVISVGMLSEGWDAKTVTHIMGLRAFTSQLLCEQVVGRGLRRTSYDVNKETGLFEPEYVNVFGVPFTFLPHEGEGVGPEGGIPPPPPTPKTRVHVDDDKKKFELTWPNVLRINHTYTPRLKIDLDKVQELQLNPEDTPLKAELAQIIEGKPDVTKELKVIDLSNNQVEKLITSLRKQRLIFEAARDVFDQMQPSWPGSKEYLIAQLIRIVEAFLDSDKLVIQSESYRENLKKRLLILLNMNKIVQHLFSAIRAENTEKLVPIFDKEMPIKSTGKMITWYTSKPCELTNKSHISHVVYDSAWEASESYELENNGAILSWVKNDHLGFVISYLYKGVVHSYYPDFLIKLSNGKMLVLEVKGIDDEKNRTKRTALKEWIDAVNSDGRFGPWESDVSFRPSDIKDIIRRHMVG
ncbi:BPTD_3080 family restriction endonuclease [Cuniculiplasma divulgatum]|jgi:type III restriction enzyme|uniref:Type III restriction protein subunit R n=1 Tax=Cuniculiplasma divulgatum TaxID=1673428 RepID=A0A1N5S5L5_9ARCH|nr:DEAD/DEAH box helicase family protein [Cuniculiplasma divulgatum]SIM31220.1 type III restriction protein subunit R [Cuniculiplasma divulgatum]